MYQKREEACGYWCNINSLKNPRSQRLPQMRGLIALNNKASEPWRAAGDVRGRHGGASVLLSSHAPLLIAWPLGPVDTTFASQSQEGLKVKDAWPRLLLFFKKVNAFLFFSEFFSRIPLRTTDHCCFMCPSLTGEE